MENKIHKYILDGLELTIPLKARKGEDGFIEDYSDLIDHPLHTPSGHPIIFTYNEPCEEFAGQITDCVDCPYFQKPTTIHFTLIGICTHEAMKIVL